MNIWRHTRGRAYPTTAAAVTDVEYCRIEVGELQDLLRRFPALSQRLLVMAAEQLHAAKDHLVPLARKTKTERVQPVY